MINTKRIYTLATVNGITHKEVKDYIFEKWQRTTTKDLEITEYNQLITWLDREEKPQADTNIKDGIMAFALNKVQLIGLLGKDPELKYTPSGVAVASFSIATSDKWKDDGGNWQEKTEWHNIVAWRKLAEICGEYLRKGKKVYIEGKLQTRNYEKDGVKRYVTEIVAEQLIMLDGKEGKETATVVKQKPEQSKEIPATVTAEEDPF